MATLTIKNLPDALYCDLHARARREHRSIAQEATHLLAAALGPAETLSILRLPGLGKKLWAGTGPGVHVERERMSSG
jgi:plasmid stability protein